MSTYPTPAPHAARRVVMITSAGPELSLGDVALSLARVCAETGQRVTLISTSGIGSPEDDSELLATAPLWWKNWPSPPNGPTSSAEVEGGSLMAGPLNPADVEERLGETGVPGVSRLDLRYFVGHPAQVVIRVPDVLAALRQIVDVVILEVPSYLSVHHGEGLTPLADVVLVVAERLTTTLDEVRRTSAALKRLEAPVVGMALTEGPTAESYVWGGDPELQAADERLKPADDRLSGDSTEELPIVEPAGVAPAKPNDDEFVVHHPLRGA